MSGFAFAETVVIAIGIAPFLWVGAFVVYDGLALVRIVNKVRRWRRGRR